MCLRQQAGCQPKPQRSVAVKHVNEQHPSSHAFYYYLFIIYSCFPVQERRPQESLIPGGDVFERTCIPGGLATVLGAECIGARLEQAEALLASLSGNGSVNLPPRIGIDPVFSRQSTLYNAEVRVCMCSEKVLWLPFVSYSCLMRSNGCASMPCP